MLNININYPYPVIREYTDDYQSTEFIGELKVLLEPDGYAVHTNFEINNKGIQILLSKRILTYALEVQCVSTWFRKLYPIHENRVIRLDPQMIHERVELIPCIVAATSIEGFTNEDFAEEYQDMKFDLNAGDIIGIGQKRTFDALYQNDIIKNGSSIVDVGGNDKLKEIQCDILAIPALFNFVREWQPGVGLKFHSSIGQNHTPEVFFCRISPPPLHRSVSPLPLCSDTDLLFFCTWEVHTFFIRQVRSDSGFGKFQGVCS